MDNIIKMASSSGMVAFGFLAYMQAQMILTAQNNAQCFEDIGITDVWIDDIGILILCTMASTLCLTLMMITGTRK
jgi:hypothetical protein|tara:strand:+ start:321 stop:545 length:225 start_codon:yes stop_codon:yes gene_type:complete